MALEKLNQIFGQDGSNNNNTIFHLIAETASQRILELIWNNTEEKEFQHLLQLKNKDGETCLHTAVNNLAGDDAESMIELLFVMGADLNAQENDTGNTVLHIAVKQKEYELVSFLLSTSMKYDIENNDGLTPYQLARQENDPKMMELFLGGQDNGL